MLGTHGLRSDTEETFNGHLEFPGSYSSPFHGEIEDGVVNGGEKPAADAAIGLFPLLQD